MINILTDSTADIPKDPREAYHIEAIPMYIQLNGSVYRDGEEIHPELLFESVRNTGQYPTTSAPSPGDFIEFFDRDSDSIYFGVSSKLSTTFRNAPLAVKEINHKKVDLIDSRSISMGYGQVVIQAAKWGNEGMGFEELGRRIRERVQQTRGFFVLDTLDYICHGGCCSAIEHFFSSLLKIRPFLEMRLDSAPGMLQKVRGARKKAINALLAYFLNQATKHIIPEIYLTYLDCDAEAEFIKEQIEGADLPIQIREAEAGCVLATHAGPHPLGIAYYIQ